MQGGRSDPTRADLGERFFQFALQVVSLCRQLEREGDIARRIGWQLLDSGTSIAANYEESRAASSRRDFLAKQEIALREAREAKLWLRLLAAASLGHREAVAAALGEANQIAAILSASTRSVRISLGRPWPK
jgi:four helix bundle protein